MLDETKHLRAALSTSMHAHKGLIQCEIVSNKVLVSTGLPTQEHLWAEKLKKLFWHTVLAQMHNGEPSIFLLPNFLLNKI